MQPVLNMRGITKRFPGVLALDHVDFDLRKGEIHALVGENGAGKSTLMKVLGGVYRPEEGEIEIGGRPVTITCPHDSLQNKVGVIYQEFNLVKTLDIASNIFLGRELTTVGMHLSRGAMQRQAREVMARLGVPDCNCAQKVKYLSVAMQQLVEIGKAIFNDIEILVMDEPTAVLTNKETESLFRVMRELTAKGISIIYISHRLEEILQMCDRITVLRDGRFIQTLDNGARTVEKDRIVSLMVGRELSEYYPPKHNAIGREIALEVRGLTHPTLFRDVSFAVRRGETLGFSGLVGAGRSEIMKAIFGALTPSGGEVLVGGKPVRIRSPQQARTAGIALVPEDRKNEGAVLGLSMADNICLASHDRLTVAGAFIPSRKAALVARSMEDLQIRPNDARRKIGNFSGGNQQKGILAKWMAAEPSIMILDEPTRGIDVGAKAEIYTLIHRLTAKGVAVIVISSELPELLGICDRILVVRSGRINGEFTKAQFDQDAIMRASIE